MSSYVALAAALLVVVELAEDDIKGIIKDIMGAATDTSFVTLEWIMTELTRNTRAMTKVQTEIRQVTGSKPMDYLKAVIKETLRLHPPAPLLIPHFSTAPATVQGYEIPAKTIVFINVWAIGRDPAAWDSPEEFKPERFVGSTVDFRGNDYKFIPFGAARRLCPGITLALPGLEMAVASLLYHFDWELAGGVDVEEMEMDEAPGLTTPPMNPVWLVPRCRNDVSLRLPCRCRAPRHRHLWPQEPTPSKRQAAALAAVLSRSSATSISWARSLHDLHLRYGTDGGLLLLQLGRRRTLVVSTAAAAADLYKHHDLAFASRPHIAAAHKLSYGSRNISFAPLGDAWRRAKKTAVVHVLSPRRVESFVPVRAAEAAALVATTRLAAAAASGDGDGGVELRGLVYSYSNAVVTRAATGAAGTTAEKLKQLLGNATSLVAGVQADDLLPDVASRAVRWVTGLEKKFDDTIVEWEKFLSQIMTEHLEKKKKKGEEEDFMDVLLRLREEEEEGNSDGFELTDVRVKSLVVDLISAATETTSVTLEWIMAELVANPSVMAKLQEEITRSANGKAGSGDHGDGGGRHGLPPRGGEGGAPAAPGGANPGPAPVDCGGNRAGVRDPVEDVAVRQRVGDREGPGGVGLAGGVPAGEVLGRRRGGGGGFPGE